MATHPSTSCAQSSSPPGEVIHRTSNIRCRRVMAPRNSPLAREVGERRPQCPFSRLECRPSHGSCVMVHGLARYPESSGHFRLLQPVAQQVGYFPLLLGHFLNLPLEEPGEAGENPVLVQTEPSVDPPLPALLFCDDNGLPRVV